MCTDIAWINRSKKILEGSVKDIRKEYRTNTYKVEFTGNMIAFTNAIWTGCELCENIPMVHKYCCLKIAIYDATPNQLLQAIMPHVMVNGLQEIIPSMNHIFISKVSNESFAISSNFTGIKQALKYYP